MSTSMNGRSFTKSLSIHEARDQLLRKSLHRELIRVTSSKFEDSPFLSSSDSSESESSTATRSLSSNLSIINRRNEIQPELKRNRTFSKKSTLVNRSLSRKLSKRVSFSIRVPDQGMVSPFESVSFTVQSSASAPLQAVAPPPPPPLPKVNSVPPPPPRGGLKRNSDPKSNKQKLKMLHWDKIRKPSCGSVWQQMKSYNEFGRTVDIQQLEKDFCLQQPKKAVEKMSVNDRTIHLVEYRRAHNLAIQLRGIPKSYSEIREALVNMNSKELSLDQLLALKAAVPSQKECRELSDYLQGKHPQYPGKSDVKLLGPVEKYFLEVKDIQRLEQRIECFIFMRSFDDIEHQVHEQLNIVEQALGQIFSSTDLVIFLQTVLTVGNILNAGTTKGGATGFKLDSLLMLHNIKGSNSDKKMSLLKFCISQGLRRSKSLGTLALQLHKVNQAAEVLIPFIESLLEEARDGFDRIKLELSEVDKAFQCNFTQKYPKYARLMRQFFDRKEDHFFKLQSEFHKVVNSLEDVSTYFDEVHDPQDHMRIFKTLKSFLEIYDVTVKQIGISLSTQRQGESLLDSTFS
eukprot:TRINITY_DN24008_c0_g1_i3.p1 TRINITY_DN24008_c0_g1~~TRINITY_DN24008_c0_g1_i3.p1  ORF type:complete len:572 (+),score=42.80 TRINITY_DN24008_c0_g1_i3:723-2438(+)